MIGRLSGVIVDRGLDGTCIVDVGGVGYEVFVPLGRPLPEAPESVTLHVHTHVREDALSLFGFPTPADKEAFRTCLGVSGVGPKLALAIVSALPANELAQVIAAQDKTVFKGIPGVGKKTAERLLLELKDKLPALTGYASGTAAAQAERPSPLTGPLAVVAGALVQMGYKPAEADRAVSALGEPGDRNADTLLRDALRALG